MKHQLLLSMIVAFLSCTSNRNKSDQLESVTGNSPATNQSVNPPTDTGSSMPSTKTINESVFPIGTYKSLSEIMKNVFSQGSTRREVRAVQGEPDFTDTDGILENWYYGRCLVQFNGQLVRAVSNPDGTLKYADYIALALSPDKIEGEFYSLLNTRINR